MALERRLFYILPVAVVLAGITVSILGLAGMTAMIGILVLAFPMALGFDAFWRELRRRRSK